MTSGFQTKPHPFWAWPSSAIACCLFNSYLFLWCLSLWTLKLLDVGQNLLQISQRYPPVFICLASTCSNARCLYFVECWHTVQYHPKSVLIRHSEIFTDRSSFKSEYVWIWFGSIFLRCPKIKRRIFYFVKGSMKMPKQSSI